MSRTYIYDSAGDLVASNAFNETRERNVLFAPAARDYAIFIRSDYEIPAPERTALLIAPLLPRDGAVRGEKSRGGLGQMLRAFRLCG